MGKITEVVEKWAAEKWDEPPAIKWREDNNAATLKFTHTIDCGECNGYVEINENRDFLAMFLYGPVSIPENKQALVMDAATRISEEMTVGNVEILRKKETWFRFRAGIDIEDGGLSVAMLNNMFAAATNTVDKYFPAVMSVCFAGVSPQQAIAEADGEKIEPTPFDERIAEAASTTPNFNEGAVQSSVLKVWAEELTQAVANKADSQAWSLVGHGAVVVHEDMDRACEMLRAVAAFACMRFVRIELSDVQDIPLEACNPFIKAAPMLVYLEPGDWMMKSIDTGTDDGSWGKIIDFRNALQERMKSFDPEYPVIYATSAFKLDDIVRFLRKPDLFDRYFHIPNLSPEQVGQEFVNLIGSENCDESINDHLGKVGELLGEDFDDIDLRKMVARDGLRLARREHRKLRFADLVGISANGLGDFDEERQDNAVLLRHTAVHEAGHASVALIDSGGKNIPEYSSVIPHKYSNGGVFESIAYSFDQGDLFTYADFCHKVRVSLAGRAAEEILFGANGISNGCRSDLDSATRMAYRAFSYWGFAPNMTDLETSASNLVVIFGEASHSEVAHSQMLSRQFLAESYKAVVEMLIQHRDLLDEITKRLVSDSVLEQEELAKLYASFVMD